MALEVKETELSKHINKFFGSLQRYPDRYLHLIFSEYGETPKHVAYLCPLCIQNAVLCTPEKLIHYTESFSLDHFPPANVGGKNTILTCKNCNNTAGHSYENSLLERVQLEGYNRKVPNISVAARSILTNVPGWLHSQVNYNEEGGISLQLPQKSTARISPLSTEVQETNNNGQGFKLNVAVAEVDKKKTTKALLKTAYLYCFDYWGYEFVFSAGGEMMRNAINDKIEYPIITPTLWFDNKAEIHSGIDIATGMAYIQKPKELLSMFVNIPLSIKQNDYKCIVPIQIPNPNDTEFKDMTRIQTFFDDNPLHSITITPLNFEFNLHHPNPYTKTWEELIKLTNNSISAG